MPLSTWIYYVLSKTLGWLAAAAFVSTMLFGLAENRLIANISMLAGVVLTIAFIAVLVYGNMPIRTLPYNHPTIQNRK